MGKIVFLNIYHKILFFITYLKFRYPSIFIENEFNKCFFEDKFTSPFLPYIYDEKQFFHMHHKLLGQPTPRQSQTIKSAETADIDNDPIDEPLEQTTETTTTSNDDKLFIHYTHEKRFQSCKRDMHRVYEDIFKHTPAMHAKLIVGNKNRRNAQHELIRKKPKKKLLNNTIRRSKSDSIASKTEFNNEKKN